MREYTRYYFVWNDSVEHVLLALIFSATEERAFESCMLTLPSSASNRTASVLRQYKRHWGRVTQQAFIAVTLQARVWKVPGSIIDWEPAVLT
jgi:hypothetical protein